MSVEWRQRASLAAAAGAELELALTVGDATVGHVADVLDAARKVAPIARVLVLDAAGEVICAGARGRGTRGSSKPPESWPRSPAARISGSRSSTATRRSARSTMVSFSITPQCHVGDDESLFETLPVQAAVVAATKGLYQGLPIAVTPVTLSLRDSFAIRAGHAEATDPRQPSLLCAAWTAGSIAHLSAAGTHSLTYFELLGPRGLMLAGAGTVSAGPDLPVSPPITCCATPRSALAGGSSRPPQTLRAGSRPAPAGSTAAARCPSSTLRRIGNALPWQR